MKKKLRIRYLIIFVLLFIIETLIAIFVHDSFIRPYVGDVLVVVLIYFAVRIIIPMKIKLLPLYIFIFAAGVEVLQYFKLIKLLGLEGNRLAKIILGSTFDIGDIICYFVGCLILSGYEVYRYKKFKE